MPARLFLRPFFTVLLALPCQILLAEDVPGRAWADRCKGSCVIVGCSRLALREVQHDFLLLSESQPCPVLFHIAHDSRDWLTEPLENAGPTLAARCYPGLNCFGSLAHKVIHLMVEGWSPGPSSSCYNPKPHPHSHRSSVLLNSTCYDDI